jgi:hypothetical protein
MFTVKWIDSQGNERLEQAKNVSAEPFGSKGAFDGPLGPLSSTVRYERDDGVTCSIGTGTVYVMNNDGKTIDRYFLAGVSEQPQAVAA